MPSLREISKRRTEREERRKGLYSPLRVFKNKGGRRIPISGGPLRLGERGKGTNLISHICSFSSSLLPTPKIELRPFISRIFFSLPYSYAIFPSFFIPGHLGSLRSGGRGGGGHPSTFSPHSYRGGGRGKTCSYNSSCSALPRSRCMVRSNDGRRANARSNPSKSSSIYLATTSSIPLFIPSTFS